MIGWMFSTKQINKLNRFNKRILPHKKLQTYPSCFGLILNNNCCYMDSLFEKPEKIQLFNYADAETLRI